MKKTIILIVIGILSVATIGTVMSSSGEDEREDEGRYQNQRESDDREDGIRRSAWPGSRPDVRPVVSDAYRNECGACHFAYQPGLLPQQSWERIMSALDDHYGDDASLDQQAADEIRRYLIVNAADHAGQSRSRAFASGTAASNALPRITETDYFRREHYEIPARFIQGNTAVGSFSNCQACHRSADTGVYNEHQVVIPGVGRWDD